MYDVATVLLEWCSGNAFIDSSRYLLLNGSNLSCFLSVTLELGLQIRSPSGVRDHESTTTDRWYWELLGDTEKALSGSI